MWSYSITARPAVFVLVAFRISAAWCSSEKAYFQFPLLQRRHPRVHQNKALTRALHSGKNRARFGERGKQPQCPPSGVRAFGSMVSIDMLALWYRKKMSRLAAMRK